MNNLPNYVGMAIGILSFLLNIAIMIGGWYAYTKITGNHLVHLTDDVNEIKSDLKPLKEGFIVLKTEFAEHCKKEN